MMVVEGGIHAAVWSLAEFNGYGGDVPEGLNDNRQGL